MPSIALFGTSADPPTAGHQRILRWLSYRFDIVLAWASDNPFKPNQTPIVHRASMLRLLVTDIQPQRSNIHCDQTLSYPKTIYTLEQAQQRYPSARFTLAVGSDLIAQLPTWYRSQDLLAQVDLLVFPRPGYPATPEALNLLRQLGAAVILADITGLPVSSSAYRKDGDSAAITAPIKDYIHREHLYACQDIPLT